MEVIAKLPRDILAQLPTSTSRDLVCSADVSHRAFSANATFERLLRVHEAEILATKRKTYKYGATDRHQVRAEVLNMTRCD